MQIYFNHMKIFDLALCNRNVNYRVTDTFVIGKTLTIPYLGQTWANSYIVCYEHKVTHRNWIDESLPAFRKIRLAHNP